MRRALLISLMLLVPFQAAWSAGHALHGHLDTTTAHSHGHDHDHDQDHHDDGDFNLSSGTPTTHGDDGHHGSHGHAAFTFMVADTGVGLTNTLAAQPPPAPPASFTSHIPLLLDPPPAVRI